jgi:DNA-binding MarR family transcriptional regulator
MSVSELANNLGVTLTTASLSVTQMATSELVIRKEDPSDHRRTIVSVSPNIEPIIKEVFTTKVQALEKGLAVLGPKRSEAFLRDLELLLEAIEAQGETGSNDHSNHKDTDVEPV